MTTEQTPSTPEQTGDEIQTPVTPPADAGTQPADAAAQGTDDTSSTERDEKGRFRNSARERIDELTRKQREAEREAAYWRNRAQAGQQPQEPEAPKPAPKPTPDQFDDYGAYVEALTDWKAESKAREVLDAREKAKADKAAADQRASTFAERQEAARKQLADYDDVVGNSDTPIAQHVTEILLDSDLGPQLAYHLATHPELADQLNAMSPTAAARELGRLEARLGTPVSTADTTTAPTADDDRPALPAAPAD